MKMSLKIFDCERKNIHKDELFEHVDKSSWPKYTSSINTYLSGFELKSIDLMVNHKMNKRIGIFNNGILIYQRNRLIKRFDC